jgi:hypothetical protein
MKKELDLSAEVCGCAFGRFPRRRRLWIGVVTTILFPLLLSIVGCGGGRSGGTNDPGTPTGTYTVVVTGPSGAVVQTTNVTVNVQ